MAEPLSDLEADHLRQARAGGVSLGALLDTLSEAVVQLVGGTGNLEVDVRNVVIHDPAIEARAGELVLGVGLDPDGSDADATVRSLAAAGAVGVVVKCDAEVSSRLGAAAADAGLALLRTGSEVDWGQLYTLVRTVCTAGPLTGPVAGEAGSPPLGDLFALANAVAAAVGGATTIEDRQLRVLAHSNLGHPVDEVRLDSIVGRKVPDHIRRETGELYRQIWRTGEVVRLRAHDPTGSRPRLAVAIRVGSEVLGTIWVIEGDRPFTDADERALVEASRLAALHLVRHAAAGDVERRRRGDVLRSVLEGRVPFRTAATALTDASATSFTVIATAFERPGDDAVQEAHDLERLADIVALHAEAVRRGAAAAASGSAVYLIVFGREATTAPTLNAFVTESVVRASHALKRPVVAGIGSTTDDRGRFDDARDEADDALRVSRRGGTGGPVVHVDDVRQQVAIDRLTDLVAGDPRLRTDLLGDLADHDERRGTEYLDTALAFLAARGNVAAAAAALFVHANTLRYRLRRMAEATGIDVEDADTRFLLELEHRMRRTRNLPGPCG